MSEIASRTQKTPPVPPYRKGWCPGALKPMETGDGLLARVRAPRGRMSLDQAAALADAAMACGNGAIGLTARANLHLRGLSEETLPNLHARLQDVGLIDADPEVERLRNIVVSPLDDLDPEALLDLGPSVAALETRLAEDEALRQLPAKFSFVLDALGRLPLGDFEADIRLEASGDGTLAVFLAGENALAAQCAPAEAGDIAARLGLAFLALADEGEAAPRRMRALVERTGASAVFARAGCEIKPRARSQRRASLRDVLGAHAFGKALVTGAAAPFGEIDAPRFKALIERARALGANGLRLTPWRAFLIVGREHDAIGPDQGRHYDSRIKVRGEAIQGNGRSPTIPGSPRAPGPRPAAPRDDDSVRTLDAQNPRGAVSILDSIAELGLIVDAGNPRLRVAACPGAPACAHGLGPVRVDATDWAALLPKAEGVILHVSGCAKGCARPAASAVTVTATAKGYDLIVAGRAGDPPARRGLSTAEIARLIASEGASLFPGAGPE